MYSDLFTPLWVEGTKQFDLQLELWGLAEHRIYVASILGFVFLLPFVFYLVSKFKPEARQKIESKMMAVKDFVAPGEGPRFRKRDRLAFMGRKVFRNAKAVGSYIRGGQGKKRKALSKMMRKVLHRGSPDTQSQTLMPDLPDEYYLEEEPTADENEKNATQLQAFLRTLRVFGHVDFSVFLELIKNIQTVTLRPREYLFRIGEPDENMYIVNSGKVSVLRTAEDQQTCLLKDVGPGETIFSLLSFIEHMGGLNKSYKTVSARAEVESRVFIISFNSFKKAFEAHPDHLTKVIQVVMVRLQRVTFLALHQYLGLGAELLMSGVVGRAAVGSQSVTSRKTSVHDARSPTPERAVIVQESDPDIAEVAGSIKVPLSRQTSIDGGQMALSASSLKKILASKKSMNELSRPQLRKLAADIFQEVLDLSDDQINDLDKNHFMDSVTVSSWDERDVILEEGSSNNPGLLLVIMGSVVLSQIDTESNEEKRIQKIPCGGILCQLQTLTDEPSFFKVTALQNNTFIASLDARFIGKCMDKYPQVTLKLAMSIVEMLSPYIRSIDFALDWQQLKSGHPLYRQNDPSDSTYVVLSGRLRSVIQREPNKRELVAEYGRGDLIGIVETLIKCPRSTTVLAVRDSEVAKIPTGLIDSIKMQYPKVMLRLLNLLSQKLQQSWKRGDVDPRTAQSPSSPTPPLDQSVPTSNFTTVAIFPLSEDIPKVAFTMELLHGLLRNGTALRLTSSYIQEELGMSAFEKSFDFRLAEWLATQEDKHQITLYECDPDFGTWTQLCLRHADVIFILADPKADPEVKKIELQLENASRRTRKELIFLHTEDTKYPTGTSRWMRSRAWINGHYHVKCPRRMFSKRTDYSKILNGPPPDIHSDFCRLGRVLTGNSVGLVLGGGGARGCAHVGIIKSFMEAGIPIDHVAGVSIGSFMGALYCLDRDLTELTIRARDFCNMMGHRLQFILDITYPFISYFKGHAFNTVIEKFFQDFDIMDTWLPYFTLTTDITTMSQRVHDYGSLWRYVRSSMSLATYLPPLCDPHDGHLLLDGGYVNNLPADVMRSRGPRHIFAVDVGSEDVSDFTNYGDSLSGFWVLLSRWVPFMTPIKVPNSFEVQLRLAYVSCVGKLESVKNSGYCHYIRPPIEKYGTMQFDLFDEIKDVGLKHGKTYFEGSGLFGRLEAFGMKRGSLDDIGIETLSGSLLPSTSSSPQRRAFSDMARAVCSFPSTVTADVDDDDDDDTDDVSNDDDDDESRSDEDHDNEETLISDEDEDNESGFLSQQ